MTWRSFLRQRSIQIALAVLVAVLAVWVVTFVVSARPRSVDQRTHDIASQLRCPVCNGESVADSSTPIAQQMRSVIRQDVQAGQSDDQIIVAFRASYGDSILLRPPFDGFTAIIWFGPIVALLVGIAIITLAARTWRQAQPAPTLAHSLDDEAARDLSPDERARLMAVLRRELAEDEGLRYTSGNRERGADAALKRYPPQSRRRSDTLYPPLGAPHDVSPAALSAGRARAAGEGRPAEGSSTTGSATWRRPTTKICATATSSARSPR